MSFRHTRSTPVHVPRWRKSICPPRLVNIDVSTVNWFWTAIKHAEDDLQSAAGWLPLPLAGTSNEIYNEAWFVGFIRCDSTAGYRDESAVPRECLQAVTCLLVNC